VKRYKIKNILQNNKDSKYAQAIQTMVHIVQLRQYVPWLMPDLLFNLSSLKRENDSALEILHGFTRSVIEDKRAEMAEQKKNNNAAKKGPVAFLDLVIYIYFIIS
jgi:hypothetical protein